MRSSRAHILLLLLLLGVPPARYVGIGQTYQFQHYTTSDGIVQATVKTIHQDSRGYLWLGTRGGIVRYDGREFRNFLSRGETKSEVNDIWEAEDGTLWFATEQYGIATLAPGDTSFGWMRAQQGLLPDDHVRFINRGTDDRVWVGTDGGLALLAGGTLRRVYTMRDGLPHNRMLSFASQGDSVLWIGTVGGLIRATLTPDLDLAPQLLQTRPTRSLLLLRNGDVIVGTSGGNDDRQGGIFRYRYDRLDTLVSYFKNQTIVKGLSVCEDRFGRVWVGTSMGVHVFGDERTSWLRVRNGLPNEYIYDILEDREGTMWFGTEDGLAKLPAHTFQNFSRGNEQLSQVILSLFEDRERNLWIGTYRGLIRRATNGELTLMDERHGLWDHLVNCVAEDANGNKWVGMRGGLVTISGRRVTKKFVQGFPPGSSISTIVRDPTGGMWVGSYGHVAHVVENETTVLLDSTDGLPPGPVRSLFVDASGVVWFGTEGQGAGCFSNGTLAFLTGRDGLPDGWVHGISQDHQGRIWFATARGVARKENQTVTHVTFGEPTLDDDAVFFVLEDSSNNLWFGTEYGVYQWKDSVLHRYGYRDGLAADIVERATPDRGGNIWFGTHGGVSFLDRFQWNVPIAVPPVSIDGVVVGTDERPVTGTAEVAYEDRTLVFRFNALSYVDERSMQFQWKLEGFDEGWREPQMQRQVRYTNLSPGGYAFAVRARNRNGGWSEPSRFTFVVHPAFWQTWWFIAAVVVAVLGLIVAVHQYRLRQVLAIERMRTRIAADLHDDIASSLASVALYADVVQQHTPLAGGEEVRPLLRRIGELSRDVMESIGTIVWAVDPRRDELTEVFHYFQRHCSQLCTACGVSFVSHLPEHLKPQRLSPEKRRVIFLILKEALNNALRHGRCRNVEFSCAVKDGTLDVALRDDGCGFDERATGDGHGLTNMRTRAKSIGADLEIASQPGVGTTLRLRLRMA